MTQPSPATEAQRRFATDVLGWASERPRVPPGFVARLRGELDRGVAAIGEPLASLAAARPGGRLLVTATHVRRATCDGWQLAPVPFVHDVANVRAALARAAIGTDLRSRASADPEALVAATWQRLASDRPGDPSSRSAWMNRAADIEAARLRAEVADLLRTVREVWPRLPADRVALRIEPRLQVRLAGGRVVLRGSPGLVLRSPAVDDRARSLVLDLATGRPQATLDRVQLRFHALLATLVEDRPPFRWASFYVTEGRAEREDLRFEVLLTAVERVILTLRQLVRLDGVPPDAEEGALRLDPSPGCSFCARRTGCSVAERAGEAGGAGRGR